MTNVLVLCPHHDAANRGVELARQSASAHLVLFGAYWLTCHPERMRVEAELVLSINPNDSGRPCINADWRQRVARAPGGVGVVSST